jgi:DNA-binding Lrp family transcriptional regulator
MKNKIINTLLKNGFLSNTEIAKILNLQRQVVEFYLKKLEKENLIYKNKKENNKLWKINFEKLLEENKIIKIFNFEQIFEFTEKINKTNKINRAFFIEPFNPKNKNRKRRVEFDIMLDKVFSNRDIVYEGIMHENILSIYEEYPKEELEKNRIYVAYGLPEEFFLVENTFLAFGDFILEFNDKKESLTIQKNNEIKKVIEMAVLFGKRYGKQLNINQKIQSLQTQQEK